MHYAIRNQWRTPSWPVSVRTISDSSSLPVRAVNFVGEDCIIGMESPSRGGR